MGPVAARVRWNAFRPHRKAPARINGSRCRRSFRLRGKILNNFSADCAGDSVSYFYGEMKQGEKNAVGGKVKIGDGRLQAGKGTK